MSNVENKDTCEAYDSGYCYSLGRPLTEEEEQYCEFECYAYTDECHKKEEEKAIKAKQSADRLKAEREKKSSEIITLTGADRVRIRPAVIFGSGDKEGAVRAVKMLTTYLLNWSDNIEISVENNEISITCTGLKYSFRNSNFRDFCDDASLMNDLMPLYVAQAVTNKFYLEYGCNHVEAFKCFNGRPAAHLTSVKTTSTFEEHITVRFDISREVFKYTDDITAKDLEFVKVL